jgi:hypothetical protein
MQNTDFVHFSSEQCPVLLLSIMLYMVARICTTRGEGSANAPAFLTGLVAGLMPFTKMQGLPIAAALSLVFVHAVWLRHERQAAPTVRSLGYMVLGSLVPAAGVALYLTVFSIWEPFWRSYIQTNLLFYAGFNKAGTASKLDNFIWLTKTKDLRALIVTTGVFLCAAVAMPLLKRRPRDVSRRSQPLMAYAVIYLLVACIAAATPGNPFPHYMFFVVMPMGFLMGSVFAKASDATTLPARTSYLPLGKTQLLMVLLLVVSTCASLRVYWKRGSSYLPLRASYLENFRGPVAQAIRRAAPPGSSMVVWGFSAELFIDSEMVQSNRYGCTLWQIEKNPLQRYFLDEFLADMRKSRPLLFVDAMTPGMFYMGPIDRSRHAHDVFPDVARHIATDYQLVEDAGGVRIYRLKPGVGKSTQI